MLMRHVQFRKPLLGVFDHDCYFVFRCMQVCELHFDSFSLYFLQSLTLEEISGLPAPDSSEAYSRMGRSWAPVLELTHNHGTENDASFSYHNGNTDPKVCVCARVSSSQRNQIVVLSFGETLACRFSSPDGA